MKDELLFCPLGGSGEIGMNLNLFAYGKPENHKWIIVDIGVTFADDTIPGIDLIYPDPGFIVDKKESLLGIVLTHAHEDHIGAISHIWPELKCNIYATPFTAALVTEKFKEKKIVSILATFDAKQVTIIFFFNLSNIFSKFFLTSISEPDLPILNMFVESHIIAKTPSSPIDFSFLESITYPINGFGSHFQSPVCNTQPSGVFIFSPFGSKIE